MANNIRGHKVRLPGGLKIFSFVCFTLFFSSILFFSGCVTKPLGPIPKPLSLAQAISLYNSNVAAIEPFSAKVGSWKIKVIDKKGKTIKHSDIGGKMYYFPPVNEGKSARLYLRASTLIEPRALVIVSNEEEYWIHSRLGDYGRWGKYIHLGKPCSGNMPVNPQAFLEFIGFGPLPTVPPYPLFKVGPEENVIEYIIIADDGLYSQREIKLDRRSNLPIEINVYDKTGKMAIQSRLSDYKKLNNAMLPGNIRLSFPLDDSYLELTLENFRINSKAKERLFRRDGKGLDDYQQIDKECENEQ